MKPVLARYFAICVLFLAGCGRGSKGVELVSLPQAEAKADGSASAGVVSGDGRFVAFLSKDPIYVTDKVVDGYQVYVRDLEKGVTILVSRNSSGDAANRSCSSPSISADGRYVAFASNASNLAETSGQSRHQVYVRDLKDNVTIVASQTPTGDSSQADCYSPVISPDGSVVAFQSQASDLVPGDNNAGMDVFLRDLKKGKTVLVSQNDAGQCGNSGSGPEISLSSDGRYVAFSSYATNLLESATQGSQVFLRDTQAGKTTLVSANAEGVVANGSSESPALSAGGDVVAFVSKANNLVSGVENGEQNVYVRDLKKNTIQLVNVNGKIVGRDGTSPSISADGRYVAFESNADDLVKGDVNRCTDVFVRDLKNATTMLVSQTREGTPGAGVSSTPCISGNGRAVVFESSVANLDPRDKDTTQEIYMRRL